MLSLIMLIGSLCTGYGGLDHAVQEIFDAELAWVADNSEPACKLLSYRYPNIKNLKDISKIQWDYVPKVNILTAGFPCQPISNAGRKLGTKDERWLWPEVARAIRDLRPELIVLENVSAILGRGLGIVLGDLAETGYVGSYCCLPASSSGAPHERDRWFAIAYPNGKGWCWNPREERSDVISSPRDGDSRWGVYLEPVTRWEQIMGRRAPVPLIEGRTPKGRLNPVLVEWMMGLPEGWVTGVPGLNYRDQLHLLGNGVVPHQAVRAIKNLVRTI